MRQDPFRFGRLPGPDLLARTAVAERAARILCAEGDVSRFGSMAAWLAGWQRSDTPAIRDPALMLVVGEHGVTRRLEGVNPELNRAVLDAIRAGVAVSSVMARELGVALRLVDAGVGAPTGDFVVEPALSGERFDELVELGRDLVSDMDTDLLLLAGVGVGAGTAARVVLASLGIDRRTSDAPAIHDVAVERARGLDPIEVLRTVGGAEMAVMAGACLEARLRSIPVLLDGQVAVAAVAPLVVSWPGSIDHCLLSHRADVDPVADRLAGLGCGWALTLDGTLGEGAGALTAVAAMRPAVAAVVDVATFDEWGVR
jgi:nicotinate-nucleotide--dimethylbenzimidazole phosphoribosyltransferase